MCQVLIQHQSTWRTISVFSLPTLLQHQFYSWHPIGCIPPAPRNQTGKSHCRLAICTLDLQTLLARHDMLKRKHNHIVSIRYKNGGKRTVNLPSIAFPPSDATCARAIALHSVTKRLNSVASNPLDSRTKCIETVPRYSTTYIEKKMRVLAKGGIVDHTKSHVRNLRLHR